MFHCRKEYFLKCYFLQYFQKSTRQVFSKRIFTAICGRPPQTADGDTDLTDGRPERWTKSVRGGLVCRIPCVRYTRFRKNPSNTHENQLSNIFTL